MSAHLAIAPILLPFVAGTLLLFLPDLSMTVRRRMALVAVLAQIALALMLLGAVAGGDIVVYRLGDWPAPFGIVLVADRLAAWMVLITVLLALFALIHASDGTDGRGRHFHVLFQLQIFGLSGAFLSGDLFNLFVFFEILLIASYSLLLHGGGAARTRAGLHYVVMNLLGSTAFLFAAGLVYSSFGSLNFADLAVKAAGLDQDNIALAKTGGLLLLVVFGLKAGLLPLHLWLPTAYAETSAPVAALFSIMTKMGVYAILRVHTLVFSPNAGALSHLYDPWLLPIALGTVAIGLCGVLAAKNLGRLAAYMIVISVGTLLIAFAFGAPGIAAGLYYLPHSTFAAAVLFLLAEALRRRRHTSGDSFVPDVDLSHPLLWGGIFFVAVLAVCGLPPLSGFLGKLLIMRAVPGQPLVWFIILVSAFAGVVSMALAGSRMFFAGSSRQGLAFSDEVALEPQATTCELLAIFGLLSLVALLTIAAGPAFEFTQAMALQLVNPEAYITAVLGGGL